MWTEIRLCMPQMAGYIFLQHPMLGLHAWPLRRKHSLPSLSLWVFKCEERFSLVCTQYTSRVWTPPPQRAVWLPRLLSCWLSKGSTRHSVHSVALQPYLNKENAISGSHVYWKNSALLIFFFLKKVIQKALSSWSNRKLPLSPVQIQIQSLLLYPQQCSI